MERALGILLVVFWLHLDWASSQDKIEQSPLSLSIQEGENISMICNYKVGNFRSLQWYRQHPGKDPRNLFTMFSKGEEKQQERFRAKLENDRSFLYIITSQLGDSGTYLCAVEAQWSSSTCSLCTNLTGRILSTE
uniref:Ig-like domain-containing protein n=1 Tax=Monodelphis domestica TaxID=13616 RepID=K7DZM3_MONDO